MTMPEADASHNHGSKAMHACKNMKSSVALWVGHDLDESAEKEVRRHVAGCEGCRDFFQELRGTQEILEQSVSARSPAAETASLWPELRSTLLQRARRTGSATANAGFWRLQNLLPMGALTAACLTIWFSSNNQLPSEWPAEVGKYGTHESQTAVGRPYSRERVIRPIEPYSAAPWVSPRDLTAPDKIFHASGPAEVPGELDSGR